MSAQVRPIKPLSDHLINRIAAGEVIERPASVLKELLENSLDANASRIEIDVAGGGIDLIRVQDDGHGIPGAELTLAMARHCTSKIDEGHDLISIDSLGFRGEALASIGAVADVMLCSRKQDEPHGWRIGCAAGASPTKVEPHSQPRGTKVEVCGLFHNTPARRRFLKRPQTEYHHIHQLVRRYGFCRPDVAFVLSHEGRRRLSLPAARDEPSSLQRRRQIFGSAFAANAFRVDTVAAGLQITGWVGDAALSRNQGDLQFMAVNGRVITDRTLGHAIRLAFGDRLHPGKCPAYALYILLPLDAVDVNVHPGKAEVRFANVREVHDLLYTVIRHALDGPGLGETPAEYHIREYAPSGGCDLNRDRVTTNTSARPTSTYESAQKPRDSVFGQVVAVVDHRFALTQSAAGLKVVDLRNLLCALATRRLGNAAATGAVASRPLLIPELVTLNGVLVSERRTQDLASLGVGIDLLGPASAVLRSLPVIFPDLDTARFAHALAGILTSKSVVSVAALCRLAAESASIPGTEKRCTDLLASIGRSLHEVDIPLDDYCAVIDGDVLQGLVGRRARSV